MALRHLTLPVAAAALTVGVLAAPALSPDAPSRTEATPAEATRTFTVTAEPDNAPATRLVVSDAHRKKRHKKHAKRHQHTHHKTPNRPADSASDWKPMVPGARWNPCAVINYKVNPAGAPAGALALVNGAFDRVAAASGLRFAYAGTTGQVPFSDNVQDEDNTIFVAWTTPATVPGLGGSAIGLGGASYAENDTTGARQYVSGGVALDATYHRLQPKFGAGPTIGNLLLHEIGHAAGLAHVSSKAQEMYPALGPDAPAGYGLGDRTGLWNLGASQGCLSVQ